MEEGSLIGTILLLFTGLITYKGFQDREFFDNYAFEVDAILIDGEYRRIISSGFLHVNWIHFGFNIIALLAFSWSLEIVLGYWRFIFLYFASLVGGSLLALYIHRNHGDYRAVGASGAISGVIMAAAVLFPEDSISFFFLPFSMKIWVFGLLFIAISIFGIKHEWGNIGHEAHLGGAVTGVLLSPVIAPNLEAVSWWMMVAVLLPVIAFLVLIVRNPAVLMVKSYWGDNVQSLKESLNSRPKTRNRQQELDRLLDKIRDSGYNSLSQRERDLLEELKDDL